MLLKTQGIVLRNVKFGETSLIVDAYTAEKGRQSLVINGVRSQKAKIKQSVVAVSSFVDLVIYHRDTKDVNRIKEVKPAYIYQSIPFNVVKGTVALFMTELISKTVKESEENQMLFDFIVNSFIALDEGKKATLFPLVFPILLMPYLGFSPGNEWSNETPFFDIREGVFVAHEPHALFLNAELSEIFYLLLQIDIANMEDIDIGKTHRRLLLDGILDYYKHHVDNFRELNSHLILREVLS
ncbi:MAG: DNA repair protein RecO (recombination protein O) [Maribacter sp.]|jgi:DNA repair protein RecO (recombination protein O)